MTTPALPAAPSPEALREAREIVGIVGRDDPTWAAFKKAIVDALVRAEQRGREQEREACAKIADSFTCGGCGMDGKAAAAIRARTP